jgi:hypothetical protein
MGAAIGVMQKINPADSVNYSAGPTGRFAAAQQPTCSANCTCHLLAKLLVILIEVSIAECIYQLHYLLKELLIPFRNTHLHSFALTVSHLNLLSVHSST